MNLRDVGKRVRGRRAEIGLTQAELADKAKVGLGTVQALEDAPQRKRPRQTSLVNLEKIAKALGCTLNDLVGERDEISPRDPLLAGLNREDLQIARLYHDATTATRQRTQSLLSAQENDRVSKIALVLQKSEPETLAAFEELINFNAETMDFLVTAARNEARGRK